jgi:hypothetical protein
MTALGPKQVAQARAKLGDQGDKLAAVAMHSACYYDLVERKAIDYVTNTEARLSTAATGASTINAIGGSIAGSFSNEYSDSHLHGSACDRFGRHHQLCW